MRPNQSPLVLASTAAIILSLVISYAPADPPASLALDKSIPADIEKMLAGYHDLKLMTPTPVMTNVELALLCRGAMQSDVERARKTLGPHAYAHVSVYMNEQAAAAFGKHQAAATQPTSRPSAAMSYPVGSIIVKEKHGQFYEARTPERKMVSDLDGIGGMIKRPPGFDPDHGDWEYFYREQKKPIESGKIETCVKCHEGAKWQDHVFGNWSRGM